ncbi:MAG: tyrosine-type recombinase/integrase, partial [Solirubrobacteraceae bacterium]
MRRPLRQALDDYLAIRRQLGFKLTGDGRMLEDFVGFLEQQHAAHLTSELALTWASLPGESHRYHCRQRLSIVRGFARHLAVIDPDSEVPSHDLLPAQRQRRLTPHIYSPGEIVALMSAARTLTPPLRAASIETVIGLLGSTGLRIGEALGMDRGDVDLREGVLRVHAAKRGRWREVPLHESTIEALRRYSRLRDRHCPHPERPAFFLGSRGERLMPTTFERTFRKLLEQAGIQSRGARQRPRPHEYADVGVMPMLLRRGCSGRFSSVRGRHNQSASRKARSVSVG